MHLFCGYVIALSAPVCALGHLSQRERQGVIATTEQLDKSQFIHQKEKRPQMDLRTQNRFYSLWASKRAVAEASEASLPSMMERNCSPVMDSFSSR